MKKNTIVVIVLSIIIVILLNHIVISGVSKSSSTEFLKLPILNSIIIALVSITTMIITNYFNLKRIKLETKEKIILENFSIRRKANSKLFYALLEYQNYFNKFFKAENTFEEILDWKDFSPLEYYNKVFNLFLEQLINLHPDTIKLMEELIVKSFPLIQISLKNEIDKVEVMKDSGSIECLILTDFISEITEQLKKINGMNDLDNI